MNRIGNFLCSSYTTFAKAASAFQSPLLLVVRLYWGWSFFETGKGKLENLDKTSEFFQSLNIPMPGLNAALAGATECIGGMLLLIGLASRPAALALSFTMIVAYLTADMDAVKSIFSDPEAFLTADPFQFLFAAVLVLAFGPGWISVDHFLGRWLQRKPAVAAGSLT